MNVADFDWARAWRERRRTLIRRKWTLIVIFAAGVINAVVVSQFMTPIYEATASILVQDKKASISQLGFREGAGMANKNLNQNCVEVLKSRTVALRAAEMMGRHYDPNSKALAAFRSSISIQLLSGTDIIRIKAQSSDPHEARDIANALSIAFSEIAETVMATGVQRLDYAVTPQRPVKPHKQWNVAIAGVLSLCVGAGMVFMLEFLDKAWKTTKDKLQAPWCSSTDVTFRSNKTRYGG